MVKGHVVSIAIILILGVVISVFMLSIKEKMEKRGEELVREEVSKFYLEILKDSIKRSCNSEYSLRLKPNAIIKIEAYDKKICVESKCEEIEFNCTIQPTNLTLYKVDYELSLNGSNGTIKEELRIWQ